MSKNVFKKLIKVEALVVFLAVFSHSQLKTSDAQSFKWPVDSPSVTQYYAAYDDRVDKKYHTGMDIISSTGSTNVYAVDSGKVKRIDNNTYANENHGMGNVVIIKHDNGLCSLYAHLDKITVDDGKDITKGSQIGVMGNTGGDYGIHLHFELKIWDVLGSLDDDLGPNWGYTKEEPNWHGYINPYPYLEYDIINSASTSIKITEDSQNVRTGPDESYTKHFTTVSKDHEFVAFSEYDGWYQIFLPSNHGPTTGWVQGSTSSSSATKVEVNDPSRGTVGISVRDYPSTDDKKITYVWDEQEFVALDQSNGDGCSDFWYEICLSDDFSSATGWVCGEYMIKNVITTAVPIIHILTPPSDTKVSTGDFLGPISINETNNSDSYYKYYVQPYITKPDGKIINFERLLTGLEAWETRTHYYYLYIPTWSDTGIFTFGVTLTDTDGNTMDDDSFEFIVSTNSYSNTSNSNLAGNKNSDILDIQALEKDGWEIHICSE